MTTTRFELVVLDLAGTTVADDGLVESAFARAWDRVLDTEDGRDAALAHVRSTMGQSKIEVFRALADERIAQELNLAFENAFRALIAEGRCEEIPGAREAIEALRDRGLKIALTTGFARPTADAILDSLGWRGLADVVLTPADAGRDRPAPDSRSPLCASLTSATPQQWCASATPSRTPPAAAPHTPVSSSACSPALAPRPN